MRNITIDLIWTKIQGAVTALGGIIGYFVGGMLGEVDIFYPVWLQAATLFSMGLLLFIGCEDDRRPDTKLEKLTLLHQLDRF